jgi:hypothetical protein
MTLNRARLANIDRRLLSELDRTEDWQLVRVPASAATWSTWKRYCDVVGLSMGRAISALIDSELASVVDEELEEASAVFAERERMLDARQAELDERERKIEWREKVHGTPRTPSAAELERMADDIEPPDPVIAQPQPHPEPAQEPRRAKGSERNRPCTCNSGKKYKHCCGKPGTGRG